MADMFTWEYDAPSGTYKNHELSMKLWEQAIAETRFMEFVQPTDFGPEMGESVTLTRIKTIAEVSDPTLSEGSRIPEDQFEMSTKQINVTEIGRAVPYTSLSQDLSAFDLTNPIQKKLLEQLRLTLDTQAARAFKLARVKYIPTSGTAGSFDTDGTASTAATSNLNVYHVGALRDYLFDNLYAMPWNGGDYVGIFRTLGLRGLKNDDDWEKWHMYTDPQAKWNGEVGRIDGVRFVETNHAQALGKVGTSSVLGEGVVFGDDAVTLVEEQTPELRMAQPDDFGRSRAVAWYGVLSFDIIWETANAGEAKIIHVTSS